MYKNAGDQNGYRPLFIEPATTWLTAMCFNIFVMDEESAVQIARRLIF